MRFASQLLLIGLTSACNQAPPGPPVPTREQRLATAAAIDEANGYEVLTIGRSVREVLNVGAPSSILYMEDGTKLNVYTKDSTLTKVGDASFHGISMFFGRGDTLQMFRLQEQVDEATCQTAAEKLADLFGPGDPIRKNKLQWLGHNVMATWEYATIRGNAGCFVEFRAVNIR